MRSSNTLATPAAPNLIVAIRAGFDAIANHLILILFPVTLDLFLWLGPRLKLTGLIGSLADQLRDFYRFQDPGMVDLFNSMQELWAGFATQFNLLITFRTYPIGIPSLMVSRVPIAAPTGFPVAVEIETVPGVLGMWLLLTISGLAAGTFFFILVAQAALGGSISFRKTMEEWPAASLKVILFAVLFAALVLIAILPGGFIISLVALGGLSYGQCALLIYSGFVLWLILPLVFTPHGIIVNRDNLIAAVRTSASLMRRTLPTTMLFLLAAFLLSKGLDILWLIPEEDSWLLLIGILGHGFVATGLLASSFVYYRDSTLWVRRLVQTGRVSVT
jgi:hypothetical protein